MNHKIVYRSAILPKKLIDSHSEVLHDGRTLQTPGHMEISKHIKKKK